jgi:hypothetical protein
MKTANERIPVRGGGANHNDFPVFDCDGVPICVGDMLYWVETSGPYGETKRGHGRVTHPNTMYGELITDGGKVSTTFEWKGPNKPEGLYCRHTNDTYDHGHKTFARIG